MGEQAEPWYKDGLQFTCTQCGNCCTGEPGAVWVDADEIEQIADCLGTTTGEIRLMHTRPLGGRVSLNEFANGDCTFFDAEQRRCRIYAARPRQCRTWPFWKSNLDSPAAWKNTQRECPGAGRGDFVSLENVIALASQIDT